MTDRFQASYRSSARFPDQWEVWHSEDGGQSWTFVRNEPKRMERIAPPTDEQLEHLTLTLGLPTLPPRLRPPHWREAMLNLHAMVQKAMDGDRQANETLSRLRQVFGRGTT